MSPESRIAAARAELVVVRKLDREIRTRLDRIVATVESLEREHREQHR